MFRCATAVAMALAGMENLAATMAQMIRLGAMAHTPTTAATASVIKRCQMPEYKEVKLAIETTQYGVGLLVKNMSKNSFYTIVVGGGLVRDNPKMVDMRISVKRRDLGWTVSDIELHVPMESGFTQKESLEFLEKLGRDLIMDFWAYQAMHDRVQKAIMR